MNSYSLHIISAAITAIANCEIPPGIEASIDTRQIAIIIACIVKATNTRVVIPDICERRPLINRCRTTKKVEVGSYTGRIPDSLGSNYLVSSPIREPAVPNIEHGAVRLCT